MPGLPELIVILAIVLLIFGAGKLPAIGDAMGRTIKNFRRASNGRDELEVSKKEALAEGKEANPLAAARDAEVVSDDK